MFTSQGKVQMHPLMWSFAWSADAQGLRVFIQKHNMHWERTESECENQAREKDKGNLGMPQVCCDF